MMHSLKSDLLAIKIVSDRLKRINRSLSASQISALINDLNKIAGKLGLAIIGEHLIAKLCIPDRSLTTRWCQTSPGQVVGLTIRK
ncbi:hypothetical protein Plhal304r1_c010g0038971 [Plasmopara halstedii]